MRPGSALDETGTQSCGLRERAFVLQYEVYVWVGVRQSQSLDSRHVVDFQTRRDLEEHCVDEGPTLVWIQKTEIWGKGHSLNMRTDAHCM